MDRLDLIDPRLFLTLPEHVSNALHVWNRALFITQLSHLDASVDLNSIHHSRHVEQHNNNNNNQECHKTDLLEKFLNDCKSQYTLLLNNATNYDTNEAFLKTLNETTLMKIFKIKKRNKASLLNLILPNLVLADSTMTNNLSDAQITLKQRNTFNLFDYKSNLTPPWRPAQEEAVSLDTASSSNSSLDLCGETSSSSSSSSQNENENESVQDLIDSDEKVTHGREEDGVDVELDLDMGSRR